MTTTNRPARAYLPKPEIVLERLPRMGSVMVNTRYRGATHERMGVVGEIAVTDREVRCSGEAHDSVIDSSAAASVVVDRTGRMKGTILPRIDFLDKAGEVIFSVIGMEGLASFDAGLEGLEETPADDLAEKPARTPAELKEGDPGAAPFEAAMNSDATVTIEQRRPGFRQRWTGVIEKVSPAMGFINVMRPDFHLHLRGGAVARWRGEVVTDGLRFEAIDAEGRETGLSISGPSAAFSGLPRE
ncbi:hypothetical protein G5B40_17215 [Pikeienuella piscinae]|uniref:Haemin-degrading HemS/ChuX domain-containing protein n=1 Tax=Pikeienuella piscinae TaxID=2748098 RepID=A0A7L5C407_9RHOB|nr:hypothetical protein [Pikeienuella piscinae]QIE57024.1 hypothetical protein G5B40_17215 [Pikeienuella piscinae]